MFDTTHCTIIWEDECQIKYIRARIRSQVLNSTFKNETILIFFTTFQRKLVIIGHKEALLTFEPFRDLIGVLQREEKIVELSIDDVF